MALGREHAFPTNIKVAGVYLPRAVSEGAADRTGWWDWLVGLAGLAGETGCWDWLLRLARETGSDWLGRLGCRTGWRD